MIDALVKFGVKDQNVVLSTINKIKKAQKEIAKRTVASFGAAGGGGSFKGIRQEINARKEVTRIERANAARSGQEKLAEMRKEQFENNKVVKGAQMAGTALMGVAKAAASLDPVQFIQGTLSAAGKAATAIPFLGNVAQGALELAGISVGAAAGAVGSAKTNIPGALEIEKRNATNNRYGGNLFMTGEAAERREASHRDIVSRYAPQIAVATQADRIALQEQMQSDLVTGSIAAGGSGWWTPTDKAQFIQAVSGAFGKVNAPLATAINGLIDKGKNVEQLTQVASGNWNALGTDEGAILQQITNSFSGALPSVKQALQTELLKQHGGEVETENATQKIRRATASMWQQQDELHMQNVANIAGRMGDTLLNLDRQLKGVELRLINGASSLATAVADAVAIINPP